MSPIMRKSMDNVNHSGTGPEDDVLEQVHAVMHLVRSQQYQVLREGLHDLTHMEGKVLGYFGRHAGATQSDLAQHSGRDKAQLARLVKGLRDRGLLACQADPADRRNQRLSLTADGQAVLRTLQQQAGRLAVQAVAGMTAAEQQQLAMLLQRVKDNLGGRTR
jgi:DNA-binding MarR family transcriptional regulator